jgi:Protein of unknown function (DUF2800)
MTKSPEKRYPRSSFFYAMDNCDAAFELSQASGEEPSTPFAEKGTRVHRVLAKNAPKEQLDDAEADLAADLDSQRGRLLQAWLNGHEIEFELIEERLWMRKGLKPIYSGQPDRVVESKQRLLIPDFKTGWHPQDHIVATNAQLRSYVPLAVDHFNEELGIVGPIQEVTVAIHKPGKKSPPAVFDLEAINDARAWALDVVDRATRPGPKKPNRGPWCKYCSGKVLCPLWRDEIIGTAEYYNMAVREIPDTALRELAPKLSIAATVIEKLQARLESRVKEAPENFPDWRFEPGEKKRSIVNAAEAGRRLVESDHLTREAFMACCKVGITNLELAIRKKGNHSVAATKEIVNNRIGDLIEIKPTKDTLVYDPKAPKELTDANDEPGQAA